MRLIEDDICCSCAFVIQSVDDRIIITIYYYNCGLTVVLLKRHTIIMSTSCYSGYLCKKSHDG